MNKRLFTLFIILWVVCLVVPYALAQAKDKGKDPYAPNIKDAKKKDPYALPDFGQISKNYRNLNISDYQSWCHDFYHLSIYKIGNKIGCMDNGRSFSIAILVAVAAVVAIEVCIHTVEHGITNPLQKEFFNKVFRELMIMGLISFVISVLEATPIFVYILGQWETPYYEKNYLMVERRVKIFELVHIILFAMTIVFVAFMLVTFYLVRRTWRKWESYEKLTRKASLERYAAVSEQWKRSRVKFLNPRLLYAMNEATYMLNFWTYKHRFVQVNGLTESFKFSLYLKRRLQRLFIELIEVNWKVWVLICVGALIAYAQLIFGEVNIIHDNDVWIFMGLYGLGSLVAFIALWLWLRIATAVYVRLYTVGVEQQLEEINMDNISDEALAHNAEHDDKPEGNVELAEQMLKPDEHAKDEHHGAAAHKTHIKKAPIHNFFVLASPKTTFILIQLCLVVQCFYIAAMIVHWQSVFVEVGFITWTDSDFVKILCTLFPGCMTYFIFFFFVEGILVNFTLLSSVDHLSNKDTIIMTQYLQDKSEFLNDVHAATKDLYFELDEHHSYAKQLMHSMNPNAGHGHH